MTDRHSRRQPPVSRGVRRRLVRDMTQPASMKTKTYVSGVDVLNGHDAWAMFTACASGDIDRVRKLLEKNPQLVNAQFWYQFPIHFAVRDGNTELVEFLLNHGADAGQSTFTYNSWPKLLDVARARGFRDIEAQLVRKLKMTFRYSPDFEALKDAIISRDVRKVGVLVRSQPKLLRASDALGNTSLHWSVITRQRKLIERFADLGAPMEAQRADGQTPLLLATSGCADYWYRETRVRNHPSLRNPWVIVGSLLAKGADYSISTAAAAGDQERIEELLAKDVSLAARHNSARISPLTYAAEQGHTHIVALLLENGADPNIPEEGAPHGRALFSACQSNRLQTAQLLVECGANPNAGLDSCGCCLTICEAYHGSAAKPLQKLLRAHGAVQPPYAMSRRELKQALRENHEATRHDEFPGNVMAKCDEELLDLFLANDATIVQTAGAWGGTALPESPKLVAKLLNDGLDPDSRDWVGRSLLHGCAERFDTRNAALLLDAGADIDARDVEFRETPLAAAIRCELPCEAEERPKLEHKRLRMIRFLLKRGAATSLPDDEPWATPLQQARQNKLAEIEALLLRHEVKSSRGTP